MSLNAEIFLKADSFGGLWSLKQRGWVDSSSAREAPQLVSAKKIFM